MSHESGQFLITIYELCLAAEVGHLRIEICSSSGECNVGVPTVPEDPDFDWPGDGSSTTIEIDDTPIVLDHIARCTIFGPAH